MVRDVQFRDRRALADQHEPPPSGGGSVWRRWLQCFVRVTPELKPVPCQACNGKGAALLVPGDPTRGHDLNKNCAACNREGFVYESHAE
jgi:hypothetical protein